MWIVFRQSTGNKHEEASCNVVSFPVSTRMSLEFCKLFNLLAFVIMQACNDMKE